ncbi:6532_t:CDS:2 [Cetraspora pellucida]|uniref:6532_t:CDS:1 n=1 Tax=Cetraspora pellucida TaxID=1433469 RepID=A0A9N9G9K2_9GLOM|nr:6532_t:CDS:2 [Cetraspora pellucida]
MNHKNQSSSQTQKASRNLFLKGCILLINALVVSKIWYTTYIQPPSCKQISDINKLIMNS